MLNLSLESTDTGVVAGNAGNLTTISFVDLTKVETTDNVDFFH